MIIDVNPQTITEIAQTIANAYGEVEEAARILTLLMCDKEVIEV